MKLKQLVLAVAVIALAACGAPGTVDTDAPAAQGAEDASSMPAPAEAEPFMPHEVTAADIPPGIQEDSLARLPRITREALDADGQRAYDVIVHPDSRYAEGLRGPIGMWMYSPRMAEHLFPAAATSASGPTATAISGWRNWRS